MVTTSTRSGAKFITVKAAEEDGKLAVSLAGAVRKAWGRFEGALRKGLEEGIAVGRALNDLRAASKHGEFGRWFSDHEQPNEGAFQFSRSWANRLMTMASNPAVANVDHGLHLPTDLNTVYELATMTAPALEAAIEAGKVTPATTRAEAKAMRKDSEPEAQEPPKAKKPTSKTKREVLEQFQSVVTQAVADALLQHSDLRAALVNHLEIIANQLKP